MGLFIGGSLQLFVIWGRYLVEAFSRIDATSGAVLATAFSFIRNRNRSAITTPSCTSSGTLTY